MYGRMTDKNHQPEILEIRQYVGETGWTFLQKFEDILQSKYDLPFPYIFLRRHILPPHMESLPQPATFTKIGIKKISYRY